MAETGTHAFLPNSVAQDKKEVDLEATDAYLRRAKADAQRLKARATNWIALILVIGLVLSLPLQVVAVAWFPGEAKVSQLEHVFERWYDVLTPLVAAVVGALFGLGLSERANSQRL